MSLIAIACVDSKGVLGYNGSLAYRIPGDLSHFKETVGQNAILVGRKTYEEASRLAPSFDWVELERGSSLDTIQYAQASKEICYLGGGSVIFEAYLNYCNKALISVPDFTKEFGLNSTMFPLDKLKQNFILHRVEKKEGFTLQTWRRW
jgi:dihydrofolate reductase